MKAGELAKKFRITQGEKFRLKDFDSSETLGIKSKEFAQKALEKGLAHLSALQEKMYAQDRWALLVILQGMDASGKDSTVKHVMSGVNPQGCQVYSFKVPSDEDLDHDFMWRTMRRLPERGHIGIFNRSYYEEVLVVRVHPELLAKEKIPRSLATGKIWQQRFDDLNAIERYLDRNGVKVCKFFLHISKEEQKQRFLARLDEPKKNWKFSLADAQEREFWDEYMRAYEDMIRNTSTKHAPWYVVPADHKWFSRLVVAEAIVEALESLDIELPRTDAEQKRMFKSIRAALEKEK